MKMRTCACLGAMFTVGLLGAVPAMAGPILLDVGQSITLSYHTSNSNVSGTATFTRSGNSLIILMENTSATGAGVGVITAIGWDTIPITSIHAGGSGVPFPWKLGTKGGGLDSLEYRVYVSGIWRGLNPGDSITFTLRLTDPPDSIDLATTQMLMRNLPTGGNETSTGALPPTSVTEPSVITLMGIGLSLCGLAVRPKRR